MGRDSHLYQPSPERRRLAKILSEQQACIWFDEPLNGTYCRKMIWLLSCKRRCVDLHINVHKALSSVSQTTLWASKTGNCWVVKLQQRLSWRWAWPFVHVFAHRLRNKENANGLNGARCEILEDAFLLCVCVCVCVRLHTFLSSGCRLLFFLWEFL